MEFAYLKSKYLLLVKTSGILTKINCRAPFTLQRICEILDTGGRGYTSIDKLLNAIEKVKIIESKRMRRI